MPSPVRTAALAVAGLRVAYAAALILAPARTTRPWIGPDGERPAVQVPVRGLAVRDAVVHVGVALAALRDEPVRPWFAAGIAGDLGDIAATLASRRAVPDGAAGKAALVAGGSAAISAAVATLVDC
jgi:hypothetical protein